MSRSLFVAIVGMLIAVGVDSPLVGIGRAQSADAKRAPPQQPAPVKPASNPLQRLTEGLLERMFNEVEGRERNAGPALRAKKPASEAPQAPVDQATLRRIQEAKQLFADGKSAVALGLLQKSLDDPDDSFTPNPDRHWRTARNEIESLIQQQGSSALEEYRRMFEDRANRRLADAVGSGTSESLADVGRQYFLTSAGFTALHLLASRRLDEGRPGLALALWDRLLAAPAHRERISAGLRFKRAIALQLVSTPDGKLDPADFGVRGLSPEQLRGSLDRLRQRSLAEPHRPDQSDWLTPFGDGSHTRRANGDAPVMSGPRWSAPVSNDVAVVALLREFLFQAASPNAAAFGSRWVLPGTLPLVVGDTLYSRTHVGLIARDVRTGKIHWKSTEGGTVDSAARRSPATLNTSVPNLESLYVGNTMLGAISSDGDRIFQIDQLALDVGVNPIRAGGGFRAPTGDALLPKNRLSALDRLTGSLVWTLGGSASATKPVPLADHLFLGPPLLVDQRLFALAENKSEIRLICIEPATGAVHWSQAIGLAETPLQQDPLRRSQACFLAESGGVIVCPVSNGRIVAFDPIARSILWDYDAPSDNPLRLEAADARFNAFNRRSMTNDPVFIHDNAVFFSNFLAGQGALACIDLRTGHPRWRHEYRDPTTFVVGFFADSIVTAGLNSLSARKLASGELAWTLAIDAPAGRGVCLADRLFLPLRRHVLLEVDATGKILAQPKARGDVPLGNLLVAKGMVLSSGPTQMQAFPQQSHVEEEIRSHMANNANDPAIDYLRATLALNRGQPGEAGALLRKAVGNGSASPAVRELLFDLAGSELQTQAQDDVSFLADLGRLATTENEHSAHLRLLAESFLKRGKWTEAFKSALSLAERNADQPIPTAGGQAWLAGWAREFHQRLWEQTPPDARPALQRVGADTFAKLENEPNESALANLALQLAGSWAGSDANLALARKRFAHSSKPGLVELALLAATVGPDREKTNAARGRLAQHYQTQGWEKEAQFWGVPNRDDQGFTSVNPLLAADQAWSYRTVRVESSEEQRDPFNFVSVMAPIRSTTTRAPDRTLRIDAAQRKVLVSDRWTGKSLFTVPVVTSGPSTVYLSIRYDALGSHLFLPSGASLTTLSLLDRSSNWSRSLPRVGGIATEQPLLVTPTAVFVANRGELLALDPATGRDLWAHRGLTLGSQVFGDSLHVLKVNPDLNFVALRANDGKLMRTGKMPPSYGQRIDFLGRNVLLAERNAQGLTLRLWDPLTNRDGWSKTFQGDWRHNLGPGGFIVVHNPVTDVVVLDNATGKTLLTDKLPPSQNNAVLGLGVFADNQKIYLAINERARRSIRVWSSYSLASSIPVHGSLLAYDRTSGKRLWSQNLNDQSLLVDPGGNIPILVGSSIRMVEQRPNGGQAVQKLVRFFDVLDKRDGAFLYRRQREDVPNSLGVHFDRKSQTVDLHMGGTKVRFVFEP